MKNRLFVWLALVVAAAMLTACNVRNYDDEKPTEHGQSETKA